jgi:hypothetical protein
VWVLVQHFVVLVKSCVLVVHFIDLHHSLPF